MPVKDLTAALGAYADTRRPPYAVYADYLRGKHVLKFASVDFVKTHGQLLTELRENLCPMVRSAFADPLGIATWGHDAADAAATELGLDTTLGMANNEAWGMGDAYVIVWPSATGRLVPAVQKSRHVLPTVDATDPSRLERLVKRWIGPDGHGRAFVLYADRMERYVTADRLKAEGQTEPSPFPAEPGAWREFDADGLPFAVPTPSGGDVFPACWFKLDAEAADEYGRSVLADVLPLQDALNKSIADLIVTSEAHARPFWYLLNYKGDSGATNVNPFAAASVNPLIGGPIPSAGYVGPTNAPAPLSAGRRFDSTRQRIFTTSSDGPFGQLDPPSAREVVAVNAEWKAKVAGTVGLPLYYLTQTSGDVPSGKALRVLSERRTARIARFQRDNLPVVKGLAELLGVPSPAPRWHPVNTLDPTEVWEIAATMHDLGLDLVDVLRAAGVADAEGMAERAAARQAEAEAANRAGAFGR